MESHIWALGLAVWGLLLLMGLAGGDPQATGQPGREALAVALLRRLHHASRLSQREGEAQPVARAARPTESGLHAVA